MKRLFTFLALAAALPAHAAEPAALREKITVDDGSIALNDLLQTPVAKGDIVLFGAPAPGESGVISTARAVEAVKSYGYDAIVPPGLSELKIERAAHRIAASDIEKFIATKAAQHLRAEAQDIDIDFARALTDIAVEKELNAPLSFSSFRLEPQSGRFEARLYVPGSKYVTEEQPAIITGTLFEMSQVLQLKHNIERGQSIDRGDVEIVRVKHQQINGNMLRSLDQVSGMSARRNLSGDAALRDSDFEKAKVVDRNEMVLIMYETPAMTVTTRGKALGSGGIGDVIDVINLQSKHTIQATISGDGKVAVGSIVPLRKLAQASDTQIAASNGKGQ